MQQKEILTNLIKDNLKIRGIEIGTLKGDTLSYICQQFPYLEMITIDIKPDRPGLYEKIVKIENAIRIIELKSDDAVKSLQGKIFDFVWVDGNHSYEQVKKDILNYMPLIRQGGFIGGHDYGSDLKEYEGVKIAVDEIFGDRISKGDDLTWWINV